MNTQRLASMLGCVLLQLAAHGPSDLFAAPNVMHVSVGSDREIVLTREFVAPREVVFDALTQTKHLVGWLKPMHLTPVDFDVDLRRGGSLRYVFERPSGARMEVRGTYQVVEAPRRLVYLETYDFSPLQVRVATTLHESANGTRFEQTLTYASKDERDADFDGVTTSAAQVYDELERYLRSTPSGLGARR